MNRLVLLLAGSGLSEREISRSLREISMMSESELHSLIAEIRSYQANTKAIRSFWNLSEDFPKTNGDRLVIEQVSQMLRSDTGLTTLQASEMLVEALKKHLPSDARDALPALNKESFTSWVRKLSVVVPPSILLHEAAKIRNRLAHYSTSDWPLGKK